MRAVCNSLDMSRQDVPRTADHAASRTFYTWRVDEAAVQRQLGGELLSAACNLRARFQHECRQHWEVRVFIQHRRRVSPFCGLAHPCIAPCRPVQGEHTCVGCIAGWVIW